MRRWSIGQLGLMVGGCLLCWAAVAAGCVLVGSVSVGWPHDPLILHYRVGMVLEASLVGAALGGAGVVYQALLQNPLADPYLLGVSSGASLASYCWRLLPLGAALSGALSEQACAFAGALLALAVVLAVAGSHGRSLHAVTLVLIGVIVNAINGSVFLLLNALFRDLPGSGGTMSFLVGGLQSNLASAQLVSAAILISIGLIALFALAGQINALLIGSAEARTLGVPVVTLRWSALILASLVTAAAVAISGPIGFVGLIAPQMGRLIVGADVRRLLPIAVTLGALLLLVADAATRGLAGARGIQTLLPVGVITSLLGGPFFLLLLWRSRRWPI